MADQWDRFADQQRGRVQEALGFSQTLEVYEPSESYTQSDGYSTSYPSSPDATVDAEVTTPESDADRDEGGTTADADIIIRIPDDTGVSFTGFGESGEAAAKVTVVATGESYKVQEQVAEQNGLLKLTAVSI